MNMEKEVMSGTGKAKHKEEKPDWESRTRVKGKLCFHMDYGSYEMSNPKALEPSSATLGIAGAAVQKPSLSEKALTQQVSLEPNAYLWRVEEFHLSQVVQNLTVLWTKFI